MEYVVLVSIMILSVTKISAYVHVGVFLSCLVPRRQVIVEPEPLLQDDIRSLQQMPSSWSSLAYIIGRWGDG